MAVSLCCLLFVVFFKQKTAYEMRISDWSSDVCSSDLIGIAEAPTGVEHELLAVVQKQAAVGAAPARIAGREMLADITQRQRAEQGIAQRVDHHIAIGMRDDTGIMGDPHAAQHHMIARAERMHVVALTDPRSEEHTYELQSLMRITHADFCLKKKKTQ